jgi:hypothetical protein
MSAVEAIARAVSSVAACAAAVGITCASPAFGALAVFGAALSVYHIWGKT